MEDKSLIEVPNSVIVGLEDVRQGGKCNMLCESQKVFVELYRLGYYEAVTWLYDPEREKITGNQVNNEKYAAALNLLVETKNMINKLK